MKNKIITALAAIFTGLLSTAQNVGIGTTNPTRAKFEVHGSVGMTNSIFGGDGQGVSLFKDIPGIGFNAYFNNGMRMLKDGTGALQYFNPAQGAMAFDISLAGYEDLPASNVRRIMALYYNGNVRIGKYANIPKATLTVDRGEGVDGTAVFEGTTHRSHFNFDYDENTYIRAGKDNGKVIINDIPGSKIAMTGNVGINTSNPYFPLEVWQTANDKGFFLGNIHNQVDWEFRVIGASSGWLQLYYNGGYVARFNQWGEYANVSDRRLKDNITELTPVLDRVLQLQPVSYEMKNNNTADEKTIGFIAQDVKPLFPELVSVSRDTASGYKGINDLHTVTYNGFGVLAIKAIQEQQLMITALQAEIDQLKALIIGQYKKDKYLTIQ
jgi:hypothetical protein